MTKRGRGDQYRSLGLTNSCCVKATDTVEAPEALWEIFYLNFVQRG